MLIFDVFVDYLLQVVEVVHVVLDAAFVYYLPKPRVYFVECAAHGVYLVFEVECDESVF